MSMIPSTIPILQIRKRLGHDWSVPRTFGPDGWVLDTTTVKRGRIIITADPVEDIFPIGWVHASISWVDEMPTYDDLVHLHKAVWPDGYAYQVFAPPSQHVNLHPYALHLWGRADGSAQLPEFGKLGTI